MVHALGADWIGSLSCFDGRGGHVYHAGEDDVTHRSPLGLEETVAQLESLIEEQGWVHSGTKNMNKSLPQHGVEFGRGVRLVAPGHPEYAQNVLGTDRYVGCLMPCKIAVWEGDEGGVYLSKMKTGLMGKMFGGNTARIMDTQPTTC